MSGRGPWRRRASIVVVGLVIATATSAFIAGISAKSTLAALAGAVAAAAAALLAGPARRAQEAKHQRSEALTSAKLVKLPAPVAHSGRGRTLPFVHEITSPSALGVHPAAQLAQTGSIPRQIAALPPNTTQYVLRDNDRELRAALTEGQFILVIGDSTAGKTRSAYEAAQACLPDYYLLNPAHEGLGALLEVNAVPSRCLVWLDDIQYQMNFLTASTIRRLLKIPEVIVLATMRAIEYDRFAPKESSPSTADSERTFFANGWELLSLAVTIRLNRRFSESERARVRHCMDDPRVAEAASHLDEYGLAEYIAAGPRLLERWRNAWDVGGHPAGAAVVAAAIDCKRTGVSVPLSQDLLCELYSYYLTERGGDRLRPESFTDALAWATERVHATSSLLIPVSDTWGSGYVAFDYLVEAIQRDPESAPIPFAVWGVMLDYADATTATIAHGVDINRAPIRRHFGEPGEPMKAEKMFKLAAALEKRGEVSEAVRWYEQAANTGHGPAAFQLGLIEDGLGRPEISEHWYRRAARTGDAMAVYRLGEFYYEKGETANAKSVWRQLENNSFWAFQIANFLREKGELGQAITMYEIAATGGEDTALLTLWGIVKGHARNERTEELDEEARLFDIIVKTRGAPRFEAVRELAKFRQMQGAPELALRWLNFANKYESNSARKRL